MKSNLMVPKVELLGWKLEAMNCSSQEPGFDIPLGIFTLFSRRIDGKRYDARLDVIGYLPSPVRWFHYGDNIARRPFKSCSASDRQVIFGGSVFVALHQLRRTWPTSANGQPRKQGGC
jgi:hypothetical protein